MTFWIYMMSVMGAYLAGWCGCIIYQRVTDPGIVFEIDPPIEIAPGETKTITLNFTQG